MLRTRFKSPPWPKLLAWQGVCEACLFVVTPTSIRSSCPPLQSRYQQRYLKLGCMRNSLELDTETCEEIARVLGPRGKRVGAGASIKLLRNDDLPVSFRGDFDACLFLVDSFEADVVPATYIHDARIRSRRDRAGSSCEGDSRV